ncbi:MAG: hypothetical protein IJJ91_08490 [Synergistaceae bacterium]|nr:hypothetical protein [Synergistaceae bacterium]MBQ6665545.1 hypothetical protein [Synergistaceae bacterium]
MGKFFSKLRQVFNIFLVMALIGLAAAVFTYYLTTPEQRGTTFWISAGFIVFALVLETLLFAGIAWRGNGGKNIPVSFSKSILGGLYFVFTIVVAVWNAYAGWTITRLMLTEVGGLVVFLVPMILINMAELKLSDATARQQTEGRANLASMASRLGYIADDMKSAGMSQEAVAQVVKFLESVKYSDPTPASGKLERELENAVKELESAAKGSDVQAVIRACTLAERALTQRNEYVKNAK